MHSISLLWLLKAKFTKLYTFGFDLWPNFWKRELWFWPNVKNMALVILCVHPQPIVGARIWVQCLEYLGCVTLVTVFASWTTCAISVKGGETFTYSERNNGAGWLYLQQKLREKFHIHEYIRQPKHRICFKPFLKKRCYLLTDFLHAFWTVTYFSAINWICIRFKMSLKYIPS